MGRSRLHGRRSRRRIGTVPGGGEARSKTHALPPTLYHTTLSSPSSLTLTRMSDITSELVSYQPQQVLPGHAQPTSEQGICATAVQPWVPVYARREKGGRVLSLLLATGGEKVK